jgi:hypothetical protein
MDSDLIIQSLLDKVNGGSKRAKVKKALEDTDPQYINQYKPSAENYPETRFAVAKSIAAKMYGKQVNTIGPQEVGTVPEEMINKAMKKLAKARDIEIRELLENQGKQMQMLSKMESIRKKQALSENLSLMDAKKYNDILYPDLKDAFANAKEFDKNRSAPINKEQLDLAEKLKGMGLGKRTKRQKKPSEYNKFVSSYMKSHKGSSLKDAAHAWSKK